MRYSGTPLDEVEEEIRRRLSEMNSLLREIRDLLRRAYPE